MSAYFPDTTLEAFLPAISMIFGFLAILVVIVSVSRYIEREKLARLGIADIARLNNRDFEKYLEVFFEKRCGAKHHRELRTMNYNRSP